MSEAGREPGARGDPLNNKHDDASSIPAAVAVASAGPPPAFMPFARTIAAVCMAVGGMALVGWWFSKPLFNSIVPGLGTLKPNTALCFALGGLALAGLPAEPREGFVNRALSHIQPVAALLVLLVASLTLLSYVLNMTTGIDKLLVPDGAPNNLRVFPWRMSPISALGFSVLGIATLPWPARLKRWWQGMELLVLVTAVAAFIMLLGYAYRAAPLYSLPGFSVVAFHTALGLLLLTTGVLTVHPRFVLAGQIMALDQAGAEMRRLLPAAILLPCIVGWLLLQGQRRGWYGPELGLAGFTAANIVIFSSLIWWNSRAVRRSDEALRAHLRRVEAVAEMDRAILGMRSTREIAEKALNHLRSMVPCACASLVVFEQNSSPRRLVAAGACADAHVLPRAHSIATYEQALRDAGADSTIVLGDLNAAADCELFADLRKAGMVSYAGLPLRGEQHLLGMLELLDGRPNCFSDDYIQAAHSIADQLAIALQQALLRENLDRHTASLERRVQERTRELEVMNQELMYANRDLEEFTASAAHDLRAPLNAMAGHCGMLRELIRGLPDQEARHRMERIDASVRRMNDVIDGMLGLAQLTKIELVRRPVDLNVVAAEVIQELQQQYPNHRVYYRIDGGSPLFADPRLIRSLLVNLLSNAWKYTKHAERPSVELTRIDDETGPGFVVRDNGVGFDMNFAQHLFEPFRRMHTLAEFPGVGIGLATSARIVQRYGGRIWAESQVGKGAAFYLTLPAAAVSAADQHSGVSAEF
ncbi:GAF domain-containing protein [Steroidobacter sp. S1-65]|uniref:histidine kinase n=1 Tax=Steroidobacter gossypii TaxID=2805490 RepID=A0ABS1X4L7_9GAMM|nr:ATP-binding protein [Steroidobacter gossypii]MBM0108163.1 GAF domain-containing protein [Steroidobacter gossypii]